MSDLGKFGLDVQIVDGPIGAASALKMSYAGLTKGLIAIGAAMVAGARRAGLSVALRAELERSQPELLRMLCARVPAMFPKAYRWVAEMEQIGEFLGSTEDGAAIYEGIARLYEQIATEWEKAGESSVSFTAITALDGSGSEGFSLRQRFTITMVKNGVSTPLTNQSGSPLFAVPSNVGPRTMPNYPALAAQGVYSLGNGMRVFAGTVDDPFYIDLGAAFDSLNFRTGAGGGVLSPAQDANDHTKLRALSLCQPIPAPGGYSLTPPCWNSSTPRPANFATLFRRSARNEGNPSAASMARRV